MIEWFWVALLLGIAGMFALTNGQPKLISELLIVGVATYFIGAYYGGGWYYGLFIGSLATGLLVGSVVEELVTR